MLAALLPEAVAESSTLVVYGPQSEVSKGIEVTEVEVKGINSNIFAVPNDEAQAPLVVVAVMVHAAAVMSAAVRPEAE